MTAEISKAVLITGCSTGIGRATAERFANNGWDTYATARRIEAVKDLEDVGCRTLALDVCDEESMVAAVKAVEAECGAVGVLVNNAGFSVTGAIEEVPIDEVRRQFDTNVFGLVRMCQLVLPGMRSQGWGRIINIGSMGGKLTFPGMGFYHGTKYALEAISDALRFEVRPFGVGVSLVEPGIIKTAFGETATHNLDAAGSSETSTVYRSFNAAISKKLAEQYDGLVGRMAAGPDSVAKAIEHAATARVPRTRYVITAGAWISLASRRVLPDRGWDMVMRTQFEEPKAQ